MLYPYPNEERTYAREISRVFGYLSILFAIFLPPTGFVMGIIGYVYEKKDAQANNDSYSYQNLILNGLGVVIGTLLMLHFVLFKLF